MKKNLHLYQSPFRSESRILRETKTIVDSGFIDKVVIAAVWENGLHLKEKLDDKRSVYRMRCWMTCLPSTRISRMLILIEWAIRIPLKFFWQNFDVINCHSLFTLPIGVFFKLFSRAILIYDAHELETEMGHWPNWIKKFGKILERISIRFADEIFVVSDSIAQWYQKEYSLRKIHVIKNFPLAPPGPIPSSNRLRKALSIDKNDLLFLFQGGLTRERNIPLLLDVFSQSVREKQIVFMGFGPLENTVRDYSQRFKNIHFHPAVPVEQVLLYTSSADVGVSLTDASCLNHIYSLPNKVFEYILAGVPILVSDFPEMGRLIDDFQFGWKVAAEPTAVIQKIAEISRKGLQQKKINLLKCRKSFAWENEATKLLNVYSRLVA